MANNQVKFETIHIHLRPSTAISKQIYLFETKEIIC